MQLSRFVLPFGIIRYFSAQSLSHPFFCSFFHHYLRILRKTINAFLVSFVFSLKTCTVSRCQLLFVIHRKYKEEKIEENKTLEASFLHGCLQRRCFQPKNANVPRIQLRLNILSVCIKYEYVISNRNQLTSILPILMT